MSIEVAIQENTAAVRELQVAISTFVQFLSAAGDVATAKQPRGKKTEVAAAAAAVAAPTPVATPAAAPAATPAAAERPAAGAYLPAGHPLFPVNPGDHPNTRYFYDSRSDTAFAWAHDMPEPTLRDSSVQISGPEYLQKQAEIAARHPTAAKPQATATVAQPTPQAAPTPAPAAPAPAAVDTTPTAAAAVAAAPTPSASPTTAAPSAKELTDRLMALFKAKGPVAVQSILTKYGVKTVPALVSLPDLHAVAADLAAAEA